MSHLSLWFGYLISLSLPCGPLCSAVHVQLCSLPLVSSSRACLSRFFILAPALPLFGRFQCGLVLSLCSLPVFLLGVLPPDFQRADFLASTVGDADADAASRC